MGQVVLGTVDKWNVEGYPMFFDEITVNRRLNLSIA